jgi:CBS domain-containing membrane protein
MASAMKVESLMSTALVTVREGDSIATADLEMKLGSLRHIPVVDDRGNLIGLLSARDVLASLAGGKRKVRVGDCMTREVITVTPETPVPTAIDLLLENQFGSLPVVGSDGHLMGIVTETDFLRAARQLLVAAAPSIWEWR